MDGNKPCEATATYRPQCGCRVEMEFKRGDMPVPCPKCGESVNWMFVRSQWLNPPEDFKPHLRKRLKDAGEEEQPPGAGRMSGVA